MTVRGEKAAGLDVRASLGTYARLDTQVMLKNDLQVGNSRQRARAAMDLARSGGPEIVPDLIKALKDDDAQVRAAAAAALAERREPQAMERILKLIHDVDPGVRDAAFEAAVRYGAAALPPLEEIARKGGPARAGALRALGDIGDPNALPALRAGLSEKDCALRAAAADGLGWLGALSGEGVPGGPHAGGTEGGGVADLLKQSLADPCPAAAEASALSLGRISDRAALPKLLEIASADPASARLPEVLRALANYATLDAVAAVERRLQAPDPIGPAAREAAAALYATSARAGEPLHRSEALKRLVALGGEEAMNAIRLVIEARPGESFDPEWQAQLEAALRKVVAGE